jgi:hypothetical protein
MRATPPAELYASFDTRAQGAGYRALLDRAKRLPGVDDASNAPEVRVGEGPTASSRRVDVTLFWQSPGEASPRRYDASAVVASR